MDFDIWGGAIVATGTTSEGLGLQGQERSEAFARLVKRYPRVARDWDETKIRLKRFCFPDGWMDGYHAWWTKEVAKHPA